MYKEVIIMKKLASVAKKFAPALITCLTLVLTINANSSSCYILNQPKEPKTINRFKRFQ